MAGVEISPPASASDDPEAGPTEPVAFREAAGRPPAGPAVISAFAPIPIGPITLGLDNDTPVHVSVEESPAASALAAPVMLDDPSETPISPRPKHTRRSFRCRRIIEAWARSWPSLGSRQELVARRIDVFGARDAAHVLCRVAERGNPPRGSKVRPPMRMMQITRMTRIIP